MRALSLLWVLSMGVALGCADDPSEPVPSRRFVGRPVRVVQSDAFSERCQAAAREAVAYLRMQQVSMTLEVQPAGASIFFGVVQGGTVALVPAKLSDNVRAETRLARTVGGEIYAAEVSLALCDALTVAHELGHALGLVHVDLRENLMAYAIVLGGWSLTDLQRAWIANGNVATALEPSSGAVTHWSEADEVIRCE